MNRTRSAVMITVAALTLAAFPARRSAADDESKDVQIEIEAPLDATNCTATPATITVLGLSIDVSSAEISASAPSSATPAPTPPTAADDGGRRRGGSTSTTAPGANCYYNFCTPPAVQVPTGCAALAVGQPVEVKLATDHTPLAATEVKQDASTAHNVKLQGPLQDFDATAQTVTVLGLAIDVSGAGLEGADDDSNDGHSQPIDLSHLMVGQSVEVTLASNVAPLAATEVEVKNFTNQLQIDLTDPDGNPVGDVGVDGKPVTDVQVDVVQTVPVPTPAAGTSSESGPKVLRFHTGSNGRVTLRGLATTRARIFVTRLHAPFRLVSRFAAALVQTRQSALQRRSCA